MSDFSWPIVRHMTKSVSTQWAIRVTTDQITSVKMHSRSIHSLVMSERLARRLRKAHYHIAIQFDEPKDDNSVRYAVKKHFQVKGNGLYSIKVWDGLPKYVALFLQRVSRSSSCHDWLIWWPCDSRWVLSDAPQSGWKSLSKLKP